MYRNVKLLARKNRANGRGGFGSGFLAYAQMHNKISQVLDFQRFGSLCKFCACIVQALCKIDKPWKLCYNNINHTHQLLDFQHFANITQTLVSQRF